MLDKFGKLVRDIRITRSLLLYDMAKELDISMKSYCRYEKNEREPTASLLVEMARFYHVSLDYLVGLKDERQ